MTNQEINNALIEYAKEDTDLAIESGSMCVTGTKSGVITINHDNGVFQAFNNSAEQLTGKLDRQRMINWLTQTVRC